MNLRMLKLAVPALLLTAIFAIGETWEDHDHQGLCARLSLCIYQGIEKADQRGMRHCVREGGIAIGDSEDKWGHLLANRRHHSIKRPERQIA